MAIDQKDIIAQSMVPEGTALTAATLARMTGGERRAKASTIVAANKLDKSYQAAKANNEDPRDVLKQGLKEPQVELRTADGNILDTNDALKKRIGSEVTPIVPGTPEETRFNNAKDIVDFATKFAEVGYDNLDPAERGRLNGMRANLVMNVLNRREGFRTLAPEEKQAIVDAWFRNPDYQNAIGTSIVEGFKPDDPLLTEIENTANELKTKKQALDEAKTGFTAKQKEWTDNRAEIRRLQAREAEFATGAAADVELQDLITNEGTIRTDITNATDTLTTGEGRTRDELIALKAEVKRKQDAHIAISDPLEFRVSLLMAEEAKLQRKDDLQREKDGLPGKIRELQAKRPEIVQQMREQRVKVGDAEDAFNEVYDKKVDQEQKVLDRANNVFVDGAKQHLDNEVDARAEESYKQHQEEMKNTAEADDRKMKDGIFNRHNRTERNGDRIKVKVDKMSVNRDEVEVLFGAGPKAIVREVLFAGVVPGSDEERRLEELMKDEAFVNQWSGEVMASIIAKKIETNTLFEGEIRAFSEKGWDKAIDDGIGKSKALAERIDKALGAQSGGHGYVNRAQRIAGDNWFKFLGLLALGVPLGAIGAGSLVTNRAIANEGGRAA